MPSAPNPTIEVTPFLHLNGCRPPAKKTGGLFCLPIDTVKPFQISDRNVVCSLLRKCLVCRRVRRKEAFAVLEGFIFSERTVEKKMKRRLIQLTVVACLLIGLLSLSVLGQRRGGRNRDRRAETVYCESGDMRRHWCSEGIGRSVTLIKQKSEARCVRGRSWGVDRQGIWVDRGCRADFEVR